MQQYNNIPNLYTDKISPSNGHTYNLMVHVPEDYQTVSYPMILAWNGRGETNGPVSGLYKYFFQGMTPANPNPPFKCVVLCVQGMGWADNNNANINVGKVQDEIYQTLKANFNTSELVMVGISEGGMLSAYALYRWPNGMAKDWVLYCPLSSQMDQTTKYNGWPVVASNIAKSGIPVYGTGDLAEVHGSNTKAGIALLKADNPAGEYYFEPTPGTGHGGWDKVLAFSSTLFNGKSFWQLAQQKTVGGTPTPPTKTIMGVVVGYNDGSSFNTTKPVKSVTFSYIDGTSETKS